MSSLIAAVLDLAIKEYEARGISAATPQAIASRAAEIVQSYDDNAIRRLRAAGAGVVFENDEYKIKMTRRPPPAPGGPALVRLSVRRRDGDPVHSWADL
jgi:hypothetical protein